MQLTERFSIKRFTRGERARTVQVTLNHRRVFILPNPSGLAMAGLFGLMLIASINYSNSMGFVFTFLLASVAQVSSFYGFKNLSGLSVFSLKNDPCYLSQQGQVSFLIKETEGRERWSIVCTLEGEQYVIDHLAPYQSTEVTLNVTPTHRGWFFPQTFTLSTTFPLGVFRAWSPLLLEQKILVFPKPVSFSQPLPAVQKPSLDGQTAQTQLGTDDFAGFKRYQAGDARNRIHWKAWAREKGLFTKVYSAHERREIWLDWQSCHHKDTESRLCELTHWVNEADNADFYYGLKLPGLTIEPGTGAVHKLQCLKALALFNEANHV